MANIYVKTFGCALNQSDSELMAGLLESEGHKIVIDEKKADVVIINSCTVKNEAENKLYREIRRHDKKKIIVAGCVAQADKSVVETKLKGYSVIGTSQLTRICDAVEQTLDGNRFVLLDREKNMRLNLPKIRKNKIVEIVPISEGCKGVCTYCKTKQARGNLLSYDPKDIIKQVRTSVKEGAKEIWLTSQDTGSYGLDIKTTLPKLLKEIISIEGNFKVRLGMCNPNFALKYLDELCLILNHDKMYRFIHIPVQSGSNKVLKAMKRAYTKEDFLKVVNTLKQKVPKLTIATDVIVGFPEESEEDFNETLTIIKEIRPDILNMSKYWKRPDTPAADMKPIDSKIIKERSIMLREEFHRISLKNNKRWIGWSGKVIVEDKNRDGSFTARNFAYKPVIIKRKTIKIGQEISVKIKKAGTWDLRE